MLEDYYVKPSTIDRVRSSWLAPQIERYLECQSFFAQELQARRTATPGNTSCTACTEVSL
jgi:hypothetical protein